MPLTNAHTNYFSSTPATDASMERDNQQLSDIDARVEQLRAEAAGRLARRGHDAAGSLQQSLERDVQMQELAQRLHQLDRIGASACLGFMTTVEGRRIYVGRMGLSDAEGNQLMVDWRAPAAQPFFSASHGQPEGLALRRRYRWRAGRIAHHWDEVFDLAHLEQSACLDDHSAFIASLGSERTGRMQDVLSTIQADQDEIIRSSSAGALVVDGGPGTGKTVVALHRAAYLLYSDARLHSQRGRVLVVSPHDAYTSYVADVLPNLGEDDVVVSTLPQMVKSPENIREEDDRLAELKGVGAMVQAVQRAVTVFEQAPDSPVSIDTGWGQVHLDPEDWADALSLIDLQVPHNENRIQLKQALIELLVPRISPSEDEAPLIRRSLDSSGELSDCLDEYWPIIEPENLLRAMYRTPALLQYCAPTLDAWEQKDLLDFAAGPGWTLADLPLLDAARFYLGDQQAERHHEKDRQRLEAAEQNVRAVIDDLVASADDLEDLSSQLLSDDLRSQLVAQYASRPDIAELSAGPFTHVIVDEAQDLSDAQWAMVLRRCPSGSLTIVGDRAQCVAGFRESWVQRLDRAGIRKVRVSELRINYRTTEQIMTAAAEVIRHELPDANIPTSLRSNGAAVRFQSPQLLQQVLDQWLAEHSQGVAAVIGQPHRPTSSRVVALSPENAKGLEFDLVVVYRPESFGQGLSGAVRRYVAMTRSTAELVVLSDLGAAGI